MTQQILLLPPSQPPPPLRQSLGVAAPGLGNGMSAGLAAWAEEPIGLQQGARQGPLLPAPPRFTPTHRAHSA